MHSSIRTFCVCLLGLVALHSCSSQRATAADPIRLASDWSKGDVTRVEVLLEVGGDVKLLDQGKTLKKPLSVVGKLRYEERLLSDNSSDLTPIYALRHYDEATATLKIETSTAKPALRDEHRRIGVVLEDRSATLFCPHGLLTRDELDLLDVIGQSLLIERLLPDEPVAIGDTWHHDDDLLAMLLGIEALSANDVVSELTDVDDRSAKIGLSGVVNGAIAGVATEMELKAKIKFDRKLRRVTWFALLVKEQRSVGHVGPGLDVVARLQVKLTPLADPKHLSDEAVADFDVPPENVETSLSHQPAAGGVELRYSRQWHIVSDTSDLFVMRLVDRGELLSQCNIAPVQLTSSEGPISLEQFQNDVKEALSDNFGRFHNASQSSDSLGRTIYRVEVHGETAELPVQWNYYMLADGQGHQLVFAFTMEQSLAARLGEQDREVVANLRFLDPAAETATRLKTTTKRK